MSINVTSFIPEKISSPSLDPEPFLENPLEYSIATMTLNSSLIYSINLHIYFNSKTEDDYN